MAETVLSQIIDAVVSEGLGTGLFESVNGHEAASAPTTGITADVWVGAIQALGVASGLDEVSALLLLNMRVYKAWNAADRDVIDPALLEAVGQMFGVFAGGFTLGGLVRNVDVMGANGTPLAAPFGYVTIDSVQYRCATIAVPCVVNDLWAEAV